MTTIQECHLLARQGRSLDSCGSQEEMRTVSDLLSDEIAQLEAHVRGRLNGRVRDLRLKVRDQGLVLRGQTRTYHAKQLAQHAVLEASGLPIVANEIQVT